MSAHDKDTDQVDKGLAEAFGELPTAGPAQSVLRALESRTGSKLGVHLESNGPEDEPVMVTEAAKQLRDPSGRYQVVGEIGRGAVGVVYKGRDVDLGRDVAMKILKDEYAERPDVLARFVEEAQIGGQLQHPGIVPVYELGLQAGERPYFAMKLVKGETLAAHLARRSDPAQGRRRLLGIFEQVCQTIAYAHARRVVHRDLKPANVMIGAFGEVQVVDWGFAKVLPKGGLADEKESMARVSQRSVIETVRSTPGSGTQSVAGSLFGTPAYMPPEQALGDIDRLDQRSDVFGLGAILCEILTGAPPYLQEDGDLVRQAAAGALEGAYERIQKCGADQTLVELCIECLSRTRQARPESAAELAERVSDYLTSVEERARQAEVRAARARYRQRTTLVAAAAGFLILVLGSGTWMWLEGQARTRRDEATQRVASARAHASGLFGQARAQTGGDLILWDKALAAAQEAVTLATDADVAPKARRDARALRDDVTAARKVAADRAARLARDRKMLARLEAVRIPKDDNVRTRYWALKDAIRRDKEYAAAFKDYVGPHARLCGDDDQWVAALRQGDIQVELAAALDHWAMSRRPDPKLKEQPDPKLTAWLRRLARRLDGADEWRSALRAQLATGQHSRETLKQLAGTADWTQLPTVSIVLLGDALWDAGGHEEAVEVYRQGQEQHPTDFGLCFTLALHLEQLEKPRWQEAVETYRIAEALRPDMKEVLHRRGMALEQLNRHEEALRTFRCLSLRDPKDPHWLRHIAGSLKKLGRFDEAIAQLRKAIELNPKDVLSYGHLGQIMKETGRFEEAIAHYRKALEIEPRYAEAYSNLGGTLARLGRHDEAIACYEKAIELDANAKTPSAVPHHNLGIALLQVGRIEEAIAESRKALQIDPGNAQTHGNIGNALGRLGRYEEAIAEFHRALEIDPKCAQVHANLGNALTRLGRYEEAFVHYNRAIELEPGNGTHHYNLAIALGELGRRDEAIDHYRKAIELSPRFARAHVNLGRRLQDLGQFDEAIALFRKAIQLDPKLVPAHTNLGYTLRHLGRYDEALACYRKAVELDPTREAKLSPTIRYLEQEIARRRELLEVIHGKREARDAVEWLRALSLAYREKQFSQIVELTEKTLADRSELALDSRYGVHMAARAAALRSADDQVDTSERSRLRKLARTWLTLAVERWEKQKSINHDDKSADANFRFALRTKAFASVRGEALKKLPGTERNAWQALWQRIQKGAGK